MASRGACPAEPEPQVSSDNTAAARRATLAYAATLGCVMSLGKEIAGTCGISWAPPGRQHAAPLQVGHRSGELHLTSGAELGCFGEVRVGLVVTAEHRLKPAAVVRDRASRPSRR